jgi:hypothetical protein
VEDQDEQIRIKRGKQLDEAKKRHQADLVKHAYEPPKADRPQDECVNSPRSSKTRMIREAELMVQLAGGLCLGVHRQVQSARKDPQARMSGRVCLWTIGVQSRKAN